MARCCVWEKPPVGAVLLGHVAQRSGAVFLSDPGPSMKKKTDRAAKRAGDAQRDRGNTALRAKNRTADAAKHGVSPPLQNKPSVCGCGRSVSLKQRKIGLLL